MTTESSTALIVLMSLINLRYVSRIRSRMMTEGNTTLIDLMYLITLMCGMYQVTDDDGRQHHDGEEVEHTQKLHCLLLRTAYV